jgi:transmembrane protein 18
MASTSWWDGLVAEYTRFVSSVDWTQRWLWALGAYFVVMLVAILVTRRRVSSQVFFFGSCLLAVLLAQPLNAAAREHWESFASANYFGERGFFVSIIWSVPHLLLGIIALINLLIGTATLAITVKQMQFRHERSQKNKKKKL